MSVNITYFLAAKAWFMYCYYLLVISNIFIFYTLAINPSEKEDSGEQQHNALVDQLDSMPLGTVPRHFLKMAARPYPKYPQQPVNNMLQVYRGWRLWHFDCPDFNFSKKLWAAYLKPTEHFFPDTGFTSVAVCMLPVKLPNEMAAEISINTGRKMVGIALFHDGIVPYSGHSTCHGGGFFAMSVFTTTGNSDQLKKINRIFRSFLVFALHGLPVPLHSQVSGIFVRVNLRNLRGKSMEQYNDDPGDFPCKFAFELWIRDAWWKDDFLPVLEEWTAKQRKREKEVEIKTYGFKEH